MKKILKLVFYIISILIFTIAAILSSIYDKNLIVTIFCGCAAFIDSFVFMLPLIFNSQSISSSRIDPIRYQYNKKHFVDRKEIYKSIDEQIKRKENNTMWVRLLGESGIGKRTLIAKVFYSYKFPRNKFFFLKLEKDKSILSSMESQFPLNQNKSNDRGYLFNLSRIRRVFIVIETSYNKIDNAISEFISEWQPYSSPKHQLVLFTYDEYKIQGELKNKSILYEYELQPLSQLDSLKYVQALSKINDNNLCAKIVKFSQGIPSAIKFICENSKKDILSLNSKLDIVMNMDDDLTYKYICLCTIMLVKNCIKKSEMSKLLNSTQRDEIVQKKKVISS